MAGLAGSGRELSRGIGYTEQVAMIVLVCEGCLPPTTDPSAPQLVRHGLLGAGGGSTGAAAVASHPAQWRLVGGLGEAFGVTPVSLSW